MSKELSMYVGGFGHLKERVVDTSRLHGDSVFFELQPEAELFDITTDPTLSRFISSDMAESIRTGSRHIDRDIQTVCAVNAVREFGLPKAIGEAIDLNHVDMRRLLKRELRGAGHADSEDPVVFKQKLETFLWEIGRLQSPLEREQLKDKLYVCAEEMAHKGYAAYRLGNLGTTPPDLEAKPSYFEEALAVEPPQPSDSQLEESRRALYELGNNNFTSTSHDAAQRSEIAQACAIAAFHELGLPRFIGKYTDLERDTLLRKALIRELEKGVSYDAQDMNVWDQRLTRFYELIVPRLDQEQSQEFHQHMGNWGWRTETKGIAILEVISS